VTTTGTEQPAPSAGALSALLDRIAANAASEKDKGTVFERMVKAWLLTDPLWKQRFAEVWLWEQWPDRPSMDTGIDLVAREHSGELCAIQCKFVSEVGEAKGLEDDDFAGTAKMAAT